tara:strand:+ start:5135 stop:5848 length:714 start_codon:yes stop_codon:yes gene_type:complete
MAVNINTVYQRVLSIANKEQRGYITPQDFNILANQAQMDLFEQYFYDKNQFSRGRGHEDAYVDPIDIIDKKISAFEVFDHTLPTYASGVWTYPTDLYRVSSVRHNEKTCSRISLKEFGLIKSQPLLRPTANRPVYIETPTGFKIYIDATGVTSEVTTGSISKIDYIKTPTDVSWGYNVILGKAMYNASTSTNFDMHESEEVNLVNRILILAGIAIKDIGLFKSVSNEEIKDIQQEKQ